LCIHIDAFIFIALCDFGQNQNISKLILNCFEKALKKKQKKRKGKKNSPAAFRPAGLISFPAAQHSIFPSRGLATAQAAGRSPAAQARLLLPSPSLCLADGPRPSVFPLSLPFTDQWTRCQPASSPTSCRIQGGLPTVGKYLSQSQIPRGHCLMRTIQPL